MKVSQLMLCEVKVDVFSENHSKHVNALCGQDLEFSNVKTWWYIKQQLGFKSLKGIFSSHSRVYISVSLNRACK
jgi:hypothetical protein